MELINKTQLPQGALPVAAALPSRLQRGLAVAQQVKDSLTIGLLSSNGMLLFGVLFGIAIPGLVLYGLRWKLVRRASPSAFGLWALSLAHELGWIVIFGTAGPNEYDLDWCVGGYALGVVICALALFELHASRTQQVTAFSHGA